MVEAIFLLCAISPGYMTSGLQEQYIKRLRRVAPFAYIKTLTRTAGGRPDCRHSAWLRLHEGARHGDAPCERVDHGDAFVGAAALLLHAPSVRMAAPLAGKAARALYRNSMLYCVPLVNPDGADLAAGAIPETSPEYVQAAAIAAGFPQIPFPDGWKANLRGVDLNLNYPASWELAKEIKGKPRL